MTKLKLLESDSAVDSEIGIEANLPDPQKMARLARRVRWAREILRRNMPPWWKRKAKSPHRFNATVWDLHATVSTKRYTEHELRFVNLCERLSANIESAAQRGERFCKIDLPYEVKVVSGLRGLSFVPYQGMFTKAQTVQANTNTASVYRFMVLQAQSKKYQVDYRPERERGGSNSSVEPASLLITW